MSAWQLQPSLLRFSFSQPPPWSPSGRYCERTVRGGGSGLGVRTMMLDGRGGGIVGPGSFVFGGGMEGSSSSTACAIY